MFDFLDIQNPKRNSRSRTDWEGFFPYYAGFAEGFASRILSTARLSKDAVVFDPWNGSGTTTDAASGLGYNCVGFDLNPVMVVIARARLLAASEADSLEPMARKLVRQAAAMSRAISPNDPLLQWYSKGCSQFIREIELQIREHLVGELTLPPGGSLDRISGLAATFYVALFSVCRGLTSRFQSSNPTWLRIPNVIEKKIQTKRTQIADALISSVRGMATALAAREQLASNERGAVDINLVDTTSSVLPPDTVDLVLTSPPYCTRIDYTAATRIELAVLKPLLKVEMGELSRQMIGSIRVPKHDIQPSERWGPACNNFLEALRGHPSKASKGYYYKTHLDYFEKISKSIDGISVAMKKGGAAILVVQDSHYKEIHNDLPTIIDELAGSAGLSLRRRLDFPINQSMARINPHARRYNKASKAVESVLCFEKSD